MLSVASPRACNAVIAGFPAVGHGDGPENEVGFVNIEPNYANELHKRLSCRDGLIGGLGPSLQETPPLPPNCSVRQRQPPGPSREAGAGAGAGARLGLPLPAPDGHQG